MDIKNVAERTKRMEEDRSGFSEREDRIAKIVEEHGFSYWDTMNVEYQGITRHFIKNVDAMRLRLSFYFDNEGGEDFVVCEMDAYYRYHPDEPYRIPAMNIRIMDITEDKLPLLYTYEIQMSKAYNSQV